MPEHATAVADAATSGTTRDLFVAMRSRIATAIDDAATPARDLASLTKRLAEMVAAIEAIDAREEQEAGEHVEASDGQFDPSSV